MHSLHSIARWGSRLVVSAILLLGAGADRARAQTDPWPRVLMGDAGTFTIYQPQLESWDGARMQMRAAVALLPMDAQETLYGVINATAATSVDRAARTVTLGNLQIVKATFPSAPARSDELLAALRDLVPDRVRTISLDRAEAGLAALRARQVRATQPLRNDPPAIIVSNTPALLIPIDGAPVFRRAGNTTIERVVNTRVLLLRDPAGTCYLHLFDGYVKAPGLGGPWTVVSEVPPDVKTAETQAVAARQVDLLAGHRNPDTTDMPSLKSTPVPALHLATGPTELVVFSGAPVWDSIPSTYLIYATNTGSHVFKSLLDGRNYLLLSGRWLRSATFDGPWEFVPGVRLPADFTKIPDDSIVENVKASVPGTAQAREAAIANTVPHTTTVSRNGARLSPPPDYDGAPQLKPIPGTTLSYVANTATPVIKVDDKTWYACQDGVWFLAETAGGPWAAATSVPAAIYSIPPSSPLYYVTFVRIQSFDEDSISVAATPGYYGTAVDDDGVVVYGTGYSYPGYVGSIYVAYPITYGYAAAPIWTPWSGWSYGFGVGYSTTAAWSTWAAAPAAPYWGPYGAACYGVHYDAAGGYAAWGPYGWAGTSGYAYHQGGAWAGGGASASGYNAWTGSQWSAQYGHAYNSVTGVQVAGRAASVTNVYTGTRTTVAQGVAHSTVTGTTVAGERVTAGNPVTGEAASAVAVRTPQGTLVHTAPTAPVRAGADVFAGADGNVYRVTDDGRYEQVAAPGARAAGAASGAGAGGAVNRGGYSGSFQAEAQARDQGAQRADSFQANRPAFSGAGYRR